MRNRFYDWIELNGEEIAQSILALKRSLAGATPISSNTWQSQSISEKPEMATLEQQNAIIMINIPDSIDDLQELIRPNLPWAEEHFQERISGVPYNPPPSSSNWPYAQQDNAEHKNGQVFSHSYPERFWPKQANVSITDNFTHYGIRYAYGDLEDVINLLKRDLHTRQAFLPIWFPEDTGAAGEAIQRVPCTLGYHFMVRDGQLHMNYYMRSCDIMRYLVDDMYMAARLAQWVRYKLNKDINIHMGELTMFISSLHMFVGDIPIVRQQVKVSQ